jgi:hypothetical protein
MPTARPNHRTGRRPARATRRRIMAQPSPLPYAHQPGGPAHRTVRPAVLAAPPRRRWWSGTGSGASRPDEIAPPRAMPAPPRGPGSWRARASASSRGRRPRPRPASSGWRPTRSVSGWSGRRQTPTRRASPAPGRSQADIARHSAARNDVPPARNPPVDPPGPPPPGQRRHRQPSPQARHRHPASARQRQAVAAAPPERVPYRQPPAGPAGRHHTGGDGRPPGHGDHVERGRPPRPHQRQEEPCHARILKTSSGRVQDTLRAQRACRTRKRARIMRGTCAPTRASEIAATLGE